MLKPPHWLSQSLERSGEITTEVVATRIVMSLAMGLVVAGLYFYAIGRKKRDVATMPLTLTLLAILVCMVMLIVGNDIARAFTLGGTLAIIRFRTVVDDSRDSAFVIGSVVVGMGMGTGSSEVVFIGLPIFAAVLIVATLVMTARNGMIDYRLTVRVAPEHDPVQATAACFASLERKPTLLAIETAKQGAALEATYSVRVKDFAAMLAIMNAVRCIEGIQGVEAKPQ